MKEQFMHSWQNMLQRVLDWFNVFITNMPNLLVAIFVLAITFWVARNLKRILNVPLSRVIKQASIQDLITRVFSLMVLVFGFLLALGILNLDTILKSILAGAGVVGLAIGLALQGTLANTFSGVFLSIKDIINIGDYIETNDHAGVVEEITLRNTVVREADNKIVVIPNDKVLDNPFKNYALDQRMRTKIKCRVGYDCNLRDAKVIAVNAIANSFPQQVGELVEFQYLSFGKSYINFQMRFWIDAVDHHTLLEQNSEAIMLIKETFDHHGIRIPIPIQQIQMQNSDLLVSS